MAEKTGKEIIIGALIVSAAIGGLVINGVVDERSKQETLSKIACDGDKCRMLWRAPVEQCAALTACDGCDRSVIRLEGGACDEDANHSAPASGGELVRVLHCLERGGLIYAWHAFYSDDVYDVDGKMIKDPPCGVDIALKRDSMDELAEAIGSESEILYTAQLSYAPEWAVKNGERVSGFAGERSAKKK